MSPTGIQQPAAPGLQEQQIPQFAFGEAVEVPEKIIHEAVSETASRHAHVVAIEHADDSITYGALDAAAEQLARYLRRCGLRPRESVVLLAQRSIPMVVAILAILKNGCQYVPLDGGVASDAAVKHILADTKARVVLCLDRYKEKAEILAPKGTQVLRLDNDTQEGASRMACERLAIPVKPDDSAYTIYTSGL